MSNDAISDALRMMPYGFYSITSCHKDDKNAMVANWVTQVSYEPRLLVFGLQKTSYSHGLIEKSKVFVVNVFKQENADTVKKLTKGRAKNPDKMEQVNFRLAPETKCPVLERAAAYLECKVTDIIDVGGDHDIVVGEVIGAGVEQPGEPDEMLTLPKLGWSYAG